MALNGNADKALPLVAELRYPLNTQGHVAGIDVTGANVGQTVKIAAVDENGSPTAWEPADFPDPGSGENVDLTGYATEQWVQEGFQPKGETGVYILAEGETVDDAPDTADVVIDPNGETDFDNNAESDVLCVTIQSDNDGYTADRTVTEIYEAYQAGKVVVCYVINLDGNFATNLVVCSNDIACFSASVGDVVIAVTLTENGVQMEFTDILEGYAKTEDIPTDEHINALIDSKLGVIENGTY